MSTKHTAEATDEGTWNKFYRELIDEIYGERPEGENEYPDPRQIVRQIRESLANSNEALAYWKDQWKGQAGRYADLFTQTRSLKEANAELLGALSDMERLSTAEGWNTPLFQSHFGKAVQQARALLAKHQAKPPGDTGGMEGGKS